MTEEIIEQESTEELSDAEEIVEHVNPEIDSKYRLILLAAQRSKQLQKGATIRVDKDAKKHKVTRIALDEVKQNKVNFEITEEY